MSAGRLVLVGTTLFALAACGDDAGGSSSSTTSPSQPDEETIVVHLGEIVDSGGEGRVDVELASGTRAVEIHLDGDARIVEIDVAGAGAALTAPGGANVGPDLEPYDGGAWLRPRPISVETLVLEPSEGATRTTIFARGAPVPPAVRERSLVWTASAVVDDPDVVGLGRVLAAIAPDHHGGLMLDAWFRRFATTLHSERAGPAQLADDLALTYGDDPASWDLDALPFKVTGVHNRLDLADRGGGCGELRVSIASTHPTYAPFHMLFLFRQEPGEDDVGPDGAVHCLATARHWARLAALSDDDFVISANVLLDEVLVRERFLLAESVELTVSPWEWRQWTASADGEVDNPPLFQTVATPMLNEAGALRDDFLAFVAENAEGLASRTTPIPSGFRAQSARVPPSVPAERLDLTGLDPAILAAYPSLAGRIEIVGCPTCHTSDANFVQTNVDRTFSPFYERELDARGARLDAMQTGKSVPVPPFGPLSSVP
jgi:hypothetical protein